MTSASDFSSRQLDVRAFAKAAVELDGHEPLTSFPRLSAEPDAGAGACEPVEWRARGETRQRSGAPDEVWLHLEVQASVPQICQRCLQPVVSMVQFARDFLFVADERTAAQLDEELDDDVLVLSRRFDLHALIEDEILMDLPLVPQHDVCPTVIPWTPEGEGFDAAETARPSHAFAALERLKSGR